MIVFNTFSEGLLWAEKNANGTCIFKFKGMIFPLGDTL